MTSVPSVSVKRNQLTVEQKYWVREHLKNHPAQWRVSDMGPLFAEKFPRYGSNYLSQQHINGQRRALRDQLTQSLLVDNGQENDVTVNESASEPNNSLVVESVTSSEQQDTSHPKKKKQTTITQLKDVSNCVCSAINSLGEQGLYVVDLLDEQGKRDGAKKPKGNTAQPVTAQPTQVPLRRLDPSELSSVNAAIKSKTDELVELLLKKRSHDDFVTNSVEATGAYNAVVGEADVIRENNANQETDAGLAADASTMDKKSVFIGYVANQRHNKKTYHFVSGRNSDIDPAAVKVLDALYAALPLLDDTQREKKTNKVIKVERDYILKSKRTKITEKNS